MSIPETISDDQCSICMSVLIKPVTLQCKHELCLNCLQAVLKQSPTCPICRFKLKPGLKRSKNLERFVNKKRWAEIQNRYPNRVNRKLNDEDTDSEENNLEFALCVTQLKYDQEQKQLLDSQDEFQPTDKKPKIKGTKRKRDETSQESRKVAVAKLSSRDKPHHLPVRKVRRKSAVSLMVNEQATISVQPGTIVLQPEIIEVNLEIIDVQPEIIEIQPENIEVQPEIVEVQPEIIKIQPDIIEIQPDIIEIQPDIINVQPDLIEVQPEIIEVQPGIIEVHPEIIKIQPDIIEIQPGTTEVHPEYNPSLSNWNQRRSPCN